MGDTKTHAVTDTAEYLSGRFEDVEIFAQGNDTGIDPENHDMCQKMLPLIEALDEEARTFFPAYFEIPVSVLKAWIDPSCWTLDDIVFGQISLINGARVKGFVMSYTYDPPNSSSPYDCFTIDVKFKDDGHPVGLEFGPIF